MNKSFFAASLTLAATIALGGCATVINGVNQEIPFQSDPEGATIELVTGQTCETPCTYELRRGNDSMVTFTHEGYQPVMVYMQSRTGGAMAGNLLMGGIIGGVVDGTNGASNHLYPNPVYVRMVAIGATGEPVLLNKDGAIISTVAEYNAGVEEDVREGMVGQGLFAGEAD